MLLRKHNAVHFGDVFNNAGYPYIDVDNGGHIDGMILFCERMLVELNDDATVIPGHGPVVGVMELRDYIAMLKKVRTVISALVLAGKTLEEVEAAKPTAKFDEKYGPETNSLGFVNRVYSSLKATYRED